MKDIRIGNDIKVAWSIFKKDGEPFRLEGLNISLFLKSMYGKKELNDFVVTGNTIQWTFYGKDQKSSGEYSLEMSVNDGEKGMITTDACDFVRLVSCSCKLQGGEDAPNVETETIELTSTLEYVASSFDVPLSKGQGENSVKQTPPCPTFEKKNELLTDEKGEFIEADALGDYAVALGGTAAAIGKRSVAQGHRCIAEGETSHVEGNCAVVKYIDETLNGYGSHAEGYSTVVAGTYAHAEGNKTKVVAPNAHAEGFETTVGTKGESAHAEGVGTTADAPASHAEGNYTETNAPYAHAEGRRSQANGEASHAEGTETRANGDYSHAEGINTVSNNPYTHTEGMESTTNAAASHAEGYQTLTQGEFSHAEGYQTTTKGEAAHSEGVETLAEKKGSHSEGYKTRASAESSHAEGNDTLARGDYSHAEGYKSTSTGLYSHAEGIEAHSLGDYSHAEGKNCTATGEASHAEGNHCNAKGLHSHAEGQETISEGDKSHVEGWVSKAIGAYSHSEGQNTKAYGIASHSEGLNSEAHGPNSHAEGLGTKTNENVMCQHVEGFYNNVTDSLKIIGCGTSDEDRKNAVEVTQDGRVFVKGIGNYDGTSLEAVDVKTAFDHKANSGDVYNKTEMDNRIKADLVQKVEVATINGQSLINGGNIVIEGGEGSYDDTEIRGEIAELDGKVTELSSEVSELSNKVDNLPPAESDVFKAIYGKTTYEEIRAAYDSGMVVHCDYNERCYVLSRITSDAAYFDSVSVPTSFRLSFVQKNGTTNWGADYYYLELNTNKVKTISEASTDTQYPSAKAVYDFVQQSGEKEYELLLDTTFEEDVESFNASEVAPRLLECKDFIVLIEFLYDENKKNRSGYILFKNGSSLPSARIESVMTASYLTHYILRIHLGQGFDKTASIESHTNGFANPQYGTPKGNIMGVSDSDNPWDKFDFQFGFFANEKIRIYGK